MTSWAYGVTTTPARVDLLLPQTLHSLEAAGFNRPRLFVDGCNDPDIYREIADEHFISLQATFRPKPNIGNFGNWWLGMVELYCRTPKADRYVIFEDDILTVQNLRLYLEHCTIPTDGYYNLYTAPANEKKAPAEAISNDPGLLYRRGWFPSDQNGVGALGLMFTRETVIKLLKSHEMAIHPQETRGDRRVDGAINFSLREFGIKEYCHYPSLLQHVGVNTTIPGQITHKPSASFPGADFNAMRFLGSA